MRALALLIVAGCSAPARPTPVAVKDDEPAPAPPDAAPVEECVKGLALTSLDGDAMTLCSERGCWAFTADGSWTNVDAPDPDPTAAVLADLSPNLQGMVTGAAIDRGGKRLAVVVDVGRKGELELWDVAAKQRVAQISGAEVAGARFLEDRLLVTTYDVDGERLNAELIEWTGRKVHRLARFEDVGASAAIGGRRAVIQRGDWLVPIDLATGDPQESIDWTVLGDGHRGDLELAGADGRVAVVVHLDDGTTVAAVFTLGVVDPTMFAIPYCDDAS